MRRPIVVITLMLLWLLVMPGCVTKQEAYGSAVTESTPESFGTESSGQTHSQSITVPETPAIQEDDLEEPEEAQSSMESASETQMEAEPEHKIEEEPELIMQLKIGDTRVETVWEENESVEALKALCTEEPLVMEMSMYGGFEQVGSIGSSLPRNDAQTTTEAGDIVLYSGDQIVVFYGANSWAYTRLGHIADRSPEEMAELLGNGNVTITLSMEAAE